MSACLSVRVLDLSIHSFRVEEHLIEHTLFLSTGIDKMLRDCLCTFDSVCDRAHLISERMCCL